MLIMDYYIQLEKFSFEIKKNNSVDNNTCHMFNYSLWKSPLKLMTIFARPTSMVLFIENTIQMEMCDNGYLHAKLRFFKLPLFMQNMHTNSSAAMYLDIQNSYKMKIFSIPSASKHEFMIESEKVHEFFRFDLPSSQDSIAFSGASGRISLPLQRLPFSIDLLWCWI